MPYPDPFYPVVDSVAWVARLALLGVGTIQLRAKNLNDSEALQTVSDALEMIKGTPAKLVVNDYWRAAIVAGAKHLHLGQEDLAEADLGAINDLVRLLADRRVKAVFIETSVPSKNIRSLIQGCDAAGHTLVLGGELYSDAMGPAGTPEGTYIGMIEYNTNQIARALR